jgi:predicted phage terminase large subunit-like protein
LIGRVLKLAQEQPDTEPWVVLNLPALATADEPLPPEGLGRKVGQALWPARYDEESLKEIRITQGEYWFQSLYMGSPIASEGGLFKLNWFNIRVKSSPYGIPRVRYWDVASSAVDTACTTVGTLLSRDGNGVYYVENVVVGQWSTDERNAMIRAVAIQDRDRYGPSHAPRIFVELQPGSAGKDSHREIVRELAGFPVFADKVSGKKEIRAEPLAAQCAVGTVKLVDDGSWDIRAWVEELIQFPLGRLKDRCDSASGAFNILANTRSAGTVRFLHPGQTAARSLHIAVLTKDELRTEEVAEHTCLIINCVDPGSNLEVPEHRLATVLETIQLQCLDNSPADYQDSWKTPLPEYGKLPEEVLLSRETAKSLWVALKRKRSPEKPIELVVVVDDGDSDRRALSVALAICKSLSFPLESTVWMPRMGESWKASTATAADEKLVNGHIYNMVRSAASLVLGDVSLKVAVNKKRTWALLGSSAWLK